jgi:hypothetical protein
MQPPTAPHCIATKRKKPHKSLCGLGSWREQQRTIEANQKFACCQARPHRNLWGSQFASSPDATQTIWIIHSSFMCQEVFSNKLIVGNFICWFSAKQTNSLCVHRSIFRLSEDAFSVPDVKWI